MSVRILICCVGFLWICLDGSSFMRFQMHLQVSILIERFGAQVTWVWFLPGVDQPVTAQWFALSETHSAFLNEKKLSVLQFFFLSISPLFWDLLYFVYTTFVRYKKYHKLRVKLLQRLIEEYCKHHNWGFPPISILIFKIGPPLPTYFTLS